jgi:NB-ARC domain-containing protein/tetratricopeptide repeat protein
MPGEPAGDGRPAVSLSQSLTASGQSNVFVVGTGTIQLAERHAELASAVSLTPPYGDLDPNLPLRGRSVLLAELTSGTELVQVLYGLGGCGKTRLALEVASASGERGADAWWVLAADGTALTSSMRALGRRLDLPEAELAQGDAADAIWRALHARMKPWVLIFDNVDDPQVLAGPGRRLSEGRGWLRPVRTGYGLVIVTSRDGSVGSWGNWCRRHRVPMLGGTEAAGLLTDYSGGDPSLGTDEEAKQLAARLGGLPLALKIAGSYLAEVAGFPFRGMISTYAQYQAALDAGNFGAIFSENSDELTSDDARTVIGRTWELSLDLLTSRGQPEASKLLRLLATFAAAPVPYDLLLTADIMAASPLFPGITDVRIWQSLKALYSFGLIDMSAGEGDQRMTTTLHPLVRDTISRRPDSGEDTRLAYVELAALLLEHSAEAVPAVPEDPPAWPYWQALTPHATYVRDSLGAETGRTDESTLSIAYAANLAARFLAERGLYAQAEAEFRKLLVDWARIKGQDSGEVLSCRNSLAWAMNKRGDKRRADAELRDLLADELRVLGPDHLTTLATRQDMANEMIVDRDPAGAEAVYRDLLEIRTRVQGPDAVDVLTLRSALARAMSARNDHEGALAEYQAVLRAQSELPGQGPDHPGTLVTRHQIAIEMAAAGDYEGALAEFREVYARMSAVIGPDHPNALVTRHCIADAMAHLGDYAGALDMLRDALTVTMRTAAPDHRDCLDLRQAIGTLLNSTGQLAEAAAEFRAVLAGRERTLGPSHPDTLLTAGWVASMEELGY